MNELLAEDWLNGWLRLRRIASTLAVHVVMFGNVLIYWVHLLTHWRNLDAHTQSLIWACKRAKSQWWSGVTTTGHKWLLDCTESWLFQVSGDQLWVRVTQNDLAYNTIADNLTNTNSSFKNTTADTLSNWRELVVVLSSGMACIYR